MYTVKLKLETKDLEKLKNSLKEMDVNILAIDISEKKNWELEINKSKRKTFANHRLGNYNEPDE